MAVVLEPCNSVPVRALHGVQLAASDRALLSCHTMAARRSVQHTVCMNMRTALGPQAGFRFAGGGRTQLAPVPEPGPQSKTLPFDSETPRV